MTGIITCYDAPSGKVLWRERMGKGFTASPVAADGKIYYVSREGETTVLKPGPIMKVLGVNRLEPQTSEDFLASPAISNGQIFIGARTCTNINTPASGSNPGEVRGCLSIFNTSSSNVVFPADNGDVTGLQPITNRNVVYAVQQGELRIYDTTTDKLQAQQVDILGQAIDVKLVD